MFDSPALLLLHLSMLYFLKHRADITCIIFPLVHIHITFIMEYKDNVTDSFMDYIRWQDVTLVCFRFLANLKEMRAASASVPVMGYWLRESEIKPCTSHC